ncbi:ABC transporter ATP-binding protein [Roseibium sp. M-1]
MTPFDNTAILKAVDLSIHLHTESATVWPVRRVNYAVHPGQTLAIVGESGSGKTVMNFSPLGLSPAGVTADCSGAMLFGGTDLLKLSEKQMQSYRGGEIGFIFQDPLSALNPSRRIGRQIAEVAEAHLGMTAKQAMDRARELLELVGIPDAAARLNQYPHELSGGMRQRVMIASAIAGEPKVLIADEPTTALDVTVQAQIIRLLQDLQKRLGMAIVLVSHDIGIVSGLADQIAVMYAGRIVEFGGAEKILLSPKHPYTQALLDSVPRLDAEIGSRFKGLLGLPPDLSKPMSGCPFRSRCAKAVEACGSYTPVMEPVGPGQMAACPVENPLNALCEEVKMVNG